LVGAGILNSDKTVLIAGASGFVGSAAMRQLAGEGARVIGLARRPPAQSPEGTRFLSVDLLDEAACRSVADEFSAVTHVVYAAVNETTGNLVASWSGPGYAARNGAMFNSLFDVLEKSAPLVRHVAVMHGTKAYAVMRPGMPIPVPLRESLPRPAVDDFYFRQEDRLLAAAAAHDWGWTVFRAPLIAGGGRDSNLNGLLAIAVFAILRKDAGLDLPLPREEPNRGVLEMVDVSLLARAIAWSGEAPGARNQIFNVANGDCYTWPDLWPFIAEEIGVAAGPARQVSIAETIDAEAPRWAALVRRHGLNAPENPSEFLRESGALADSALDICGRSMLTSTIKIRQAGFNECIDTAVSIGGWIRRWREEGLLPPK
jgi:nucleoside-diphosphate-sugar epimerase